MLQVKDIELLLSFIFIILDHFISRYSQILSLASDFSRLCTVYISLQIKGGAHLTSLEGSENGEFMVIL